MHGRDGTVRVSGAQGLVYSGVPQGEPESAMENERYTLSNYKSPFYETLIKRPGVEHSDAGLEASCVVGVP